MGATGGARGPRIGSSFRAAVRRIQERIRGRWPTRLARDLVAVNLFEAAVRLAAQAFLAAVPLLITLAAFAPGGLQHLLTDSLRSVVGVRGGVLDQVRKTFDASGAVEQSSGAAGALVTLVSATALSRALQTICERCWRLPKARRLLSAWRWLLWLLVWLAVLLVQAPLRRGFGTGILSGFALFLLSAVLMWWWTQHLLLAGRIGWRPLLPGAVLTGAGTVLLGYASRLLMPRALDRSLAEYGPLGAVFTFLSWLIALFLVVVMGLTAGRTVSTSDWYARRAGPRPAAESPAGGEDV